MTESTHRLNRITFWIVLGQAVAVVVLLAVTLIDVSNRAEETVKTNEQTQLLIEQNQTLIDTLRIQQEAGSERTVQAVEAVFCALLIHPDERTQESIDACTAGLP